MGPGWKYKEGRSFKVRYKSVKDRKYILYFNSTPAIILVKTIIKNAPNHSFYQSDYAKPPQTF